MPPEVPLERVLQSVLDGTTVDWEAIERAAPDGDARELLRCLRELADVAQAHSHLGAEASHALEPSASPGASMAASLVEALAGLAAAGDAVRVEEGRPWGRFTLREKLGEGSFGAVYRAWDPQLERDIAIKLIHPDIARRDAPGTRVLREGRVVAKVRHENVVTVFGVESHDDHVGLCMEYVEGCTIDDVVRSQGVLSSAEATIVGQRVCAALAAVHAADLVHRDVKARNVMREDATGRIVLMDFGSGLKVQPGQDTSVPIAGTPLYMAPEVLLGDPPSPRSDVYSVGVLLYYLTTLGFPIEGSSLDEIREAHRDGNRRFLTERRPDVPASFARIVERALDANPSNRQSNAASLLHDLTTLAVTSAVAEERSWRRVTAMIRAHAPKVFALIAALAVGTMGMGFLNSWSYNYILGIEGSFVHDTPLSWARWGLKSMVAPLVVSASMWLFGLVVLELCRLIRKISPRIDALTWAASRRIQAVLSRTGYTLVEALAFATVALSFLFFFVAYFGYFAELALAVGTTVSSATDRQLRLLSPSNEPQQQLYRQVFTLGLAAMSGAWVFVRRLGHERGESVRAGIVAAGAVPIGLVLMLLSHPYRILLWNEAERVQSHGSICYLVAEANGSGQLFCPTDVKRTRVVTLSEGSLIRSGEVESIFTPYSGPQLAGGR